MSQRLTTLRYELLIGARYHYRVDYARIYHHVTERASAYKQARSSHFTQIEITEIKARKIDFESDFKKQAHCPERAVRRERPTQQYYFDTI